MKLIIILLLFPFVTWGQNLFPSKGVRRTTTPNNGKFVDSPSLVFDDKGNPLQRYTLDSPIFTFTINPTTNKLYGLSDNPEFHVIEYQL